MPTSVSLVIFSSSGVTGIRRPKAAAAPLVPSEQTRTQSRREKASSAGASNRHASACFDAVPAYDLLYAPGAPGAFGCRDNEET
jgi:hypothetical protein